MIIGPLQFINDEDFAIRNNIQDWMYRLAGELMVQDNFCGLQTSSDAKVTQVDVNG